MGVPVSGAVLGPPCRLFAGEGAPPPMFFDWFSTSFLFLSVFPVDGGRVRPFSWAMVEEGGWSPPLVSAASPLLIGGLDRSYGEGGDGER